MQYYPNSICFEDKKEIKFLNDWWADKYDNLIITIDKCNDNLYSKGCASEKDIDTFLETNIFYVISQQTKLNKEDRSEQMSSTDTIK